MTAIKQVVHSTMKIWQKDIIVDELIRHIRVNQSECGYCLKANRFFSISARDVKDVAQATIAVIAISIDLLPMIDNGSTTTNVNYYPELVNNSLKINEALNEGLKKSLYCTVRLKNLSKFTKKITVSFRFQNCNSDGRSKSFLAKIQSKSNFWLFSLADMIFVRPKRNENSIVCYLHLLIAKLSSSF